MIATHSANIGEEGGGGRGVGGGEGVQRTECRGKGKGGGIGNWRGEGVGGTGGGARRESGGRLQPNDIQTSFRSHCSQILHRRQTSNQTIQKCPAQFFAQHGGCSELDSPLIQNGVPSLSLFSSRTTKTRTHAALRGRL